MKFAKARLMQAVTFLFVFCQLFLAINCSKDQDIFEQSVQDEIQENLEDATNDSKEDEVEPGNENEEVSGDQDMYNGVVKAFPSAEGHGKHATGGRGGKVIHVTNLNDSGSGSLRAALEERGPRNVIFKVSGYIALQSDIKIANGDLTLEGNTAPGDGVIVRNHGFRVAAGNVIIRNLTRMVGDIGTFDNDDALTIFDGGTMIEDIIIDHCSFSLGLDENIGIQHANKVTISNCISANALDSGSYLVGSDYPTTNISFLGNLSVWNIARNPRLREDTTVEYINNYHYGYDDSAQMSYGAIFDMVGNVWENDTNNSGKTIASVNNGEILSTTLGFLSDNLQLGGTFNVDDALLGNTASSNSLSSGYQKMPASAVKQYVLANAGARRFIGLNDYDQDLIQDITSNVARHYGTSAPYPFPSLDSGEPYADTDNDGMADAWELEKFGNLDQNNTTDFNSNGYTDLEEFFFSLNGE